ncbi:MAG: hypothetical protein COB67_03070 [SAR324 cluster bacterium]|uniref:Uncharacterized protein n=1 Tax=SAR324 cluster bacterium TaxID=2024889 RepID=A0A2A4T9V6_9DELT|nr:MAG: hypothetical protein COB67_03070 [SAR324 cluster bacterium]
MFFLCPRKNRVKRLLLLGSCFLLLCLPIIGFPPVVMSETLSLDDSQVITYADYLYKRGEYYRAISEYKRLLYFFPKSSFTPRAKLQIGRSYMAGGELKEAIDYWEKQLQEKQNQSEYFTVKTLLGLSWLDQDSVKVFRLRKQNLQKARLQFSEIEVKSKQDQYILDFMDDWDDLSQPEYKSPWIAGSLSTLIPGAGSFYTERYVEGTYAFLITSLFYLATRDALAQDQKELGYLFGFFTVAFYGGNIYTAVNGAHKLNDQMDSDQLLQLRKKHGVWFIPETNRGPGRF